MKMIRDFSLLAIECFFVPEDKIFIKNKQSIFKVNATSCNSDHTYFLIFWLETAGKI